MKKNHFLFSILIVSVLAGCSKEAGSDLTVKEGTERTGSKLGLVPDGGLLAGGCLLKWDYATYQFGGISAIVAKQLSGDYQKFNQPKLMINGNIPDAKTMWLSLETLKAYIWKIEQAVCNKGCSANLNLGVRIYFGRYPVASVMAATPDLAGLPETYGEHHTAFLVPTYRDRLNPSVQWDFDPWHWGNNSCVPTSFKSWFNTPEGGNPFGNEKSLILTLSEKQLFSTFSQGQNPIQNHGGLIPPDPNEGTGF
jgi:hypothetical protein